MLPVIPMADSCQSYNTRKSKTHANLHLWTWGSFEEIVFMQCYEIFHRFMDSLLGKQVAKEKTAHFSS
jgi:hypothetical protein